MVYSNCQCSSTFCLSMTFCPFYLELAWWPSAGKELLSSWLSALAILILCHLNCMCSFPVWCLGQDVVFDCVGSWSLHVKSFTLFHTVTRKVWANSVDHSSLIMVYTVCHSVFIFWTHYAMVKPHCSNFRIITAILGFPNFIGF